MARFDIRNVRHLLAAVTPAVERQLYPVLVEVGEHEPVLLEGRPGVDHVKVVRMLDRRSAWTGGYEVVPTTEGSGHDRYHGIFRQIGSPGSHHFPHRRRMNVAADDQR